MPRKMANNNKNNKKGDAPDADAEAEADFASYYLQRATREFGEDLDGIWAPTTSGGGRRPTPSRC